MGETFTRRVSVRLRADEDARLDRLVDRLHAASLPHPPEWNRSWEWDRGSVIRYALAELDRRLGSSDS